MATPSGLITANTYLLTATALAAGTVITPRGPGAPFLLAAMACAVLRYATAPGADFGLAMVFATYVFQMITLVLLRRGANPAFDTNAAKLPKTTAGWLKLAFTNPRYIGWEWERARRDPHHAVPSRGAFVRARARELGITLLVLDVCHAYFALSPWFSTDAPVLGVRLAALPAWTQFAHAVVWGVYAYVLWFLPYTLLAFVTVATYACNPEEYPGVCAPFSEAYSLRNFWGRVWHQNHRNVYTVLGEAVCTAIWGPSHPRRAAKYVRIGTAFAISAIVHAAGSLALRPDPLTGMRGCSGALIFFAMQAAGVAGENLLAGRVRIPRWVGYGWVVAWGCATLVASGWLDEMVARQSLAQASSASLHVMRVAGVAA
ncbi:hypothetical protein AURDEDRAFT_179842 [Auricularia subglabra TFB-10046 SS5]|nr:hypothetical protein AURDEDRAFT_179842 [Auricularia subglabra TFB-10046 SS5]